MFETIKDGDDFQVDYDKESGVYRFSLFKDGHFVDDWIFDEAGKENNDIKKELLSMYKSEVMKNEYIYYKFAIGDKANFKIITERIENFGKLLEKL